MALRLHESVVRGELDNRSRGQVTGRLWLLGREQPLCLRLTGDCWRDLAGRRITFTNPHPAPADLTDVADDQSGEVGDITASRKVRIPGLPLNEWLDRRRRGLDAPERIGNALYLEWYSDRNGRVVIESADFALEVSLPDWEMTAAEEGQQRDRNGGAFRRFLDRLEAAMTPAGGQPVPEDRAMDEFEWERFLRVSDARTERFGELLEKFADHPDRDRLVAREMGWDKIVEAMDREELDNAMAAEAAEEAAEDAAEADWDTPDDDHDEAPGGAEDDAGRGERLDTYPRGAADHDEDEGDADDDVSHPLQRRCHELAVRMFTEAEISADEPADPSAPTLPLHDMIFHTQCTAAKLAGALHGLGLGRALDPGFLVAYLKRALSHLHQALAAMDRAEAAGQLADRIAGYRRELLEVRDGITALMERFRRPRS